MSLWLVLQIFEENSIWDLAYIGWSIQVLLFPIRHDGTLDIHDGLLWTCPSFSLIRAHQPAAYKTIGTVLLCFVFWDLNLDTLKCSMPSSVTTSSTNPCHLRAQFPSSILTYLTHISQNPVFLTWKELKLLLLLFHMPQVEIIQKASPGHYWEEIRASSSSCFMLKNNKLPSIY